MHVRRDERERNVIHLSPFPPSLLSFSPPHPGNELTAEDHGMDGKGKSAYSLIMYGKMG